MYPHARNVSNASPRMSCKSWAIPLLPATHFRCDLISLQNRNTRNYDKINSHYEHLAPSPFAVMKMYDNLYGG